MADKKVCDASSVAQHGERVVSQQPGLLHDVRWWGGPLQTMDHRVEALACCPGGDVLCFLRRLRAQAMVDDEGMCWRGVACARWFEGCCGCVVHSSVPLLRCHCVRMWARAVLSGPPDSAMANLALWHMLCAVMTRVNSETGDKAWGMPLRDVWRF